MLTLGNICVPPTVNYLQYLATGSTLTAVGPFQLPAPQSGTLARISSATRPSVQTVSDVCIQCIRSLDTSAFSTLDSCGWPHYINILTYLFTLSQLSQLPVTHALSIAQTASTQNLLQPAYRWQLGWLTQKQQHSHIWYPVLSTVIPTHSALTGIWPDEWWCLCGCWDCTTFIPHGHILHAGPAKCAMS